MKIWKLTACLMAMLLAFSSCSDSGSADVVPEITITPDEVQFESEGGQQTVTLKANDSWAFAKGVNWVTLSQNSGGAAKDGVTLTLVAELNAGYERQGEMSFRCGSKTATVKVYQAGAGSSSDEIIVPESDKWYIYRKTNSIQSGKSYLFFAEDKIAVPHASTLSYGYIKTTAAEEDGDHITTQGRNAFKITEEDGGYVIRQVSDNRVLYLMDDHNSFQVSDKKPASGHVWEAKVQSNGEFVFTNKEKKKIIQYDPAYSTYAAYSTVTGEYPLLYECITETAGPGGITLNGMPKWMELPQTKDDDGLDFYFHEHVTGGKADRSWSFDYDSKALLAHWIAYPLNKTLRGSGTRTDQWGLDPKVPASQQPVLYTTYKADNGKKYARGHQLPSADRLDYSENVKTFYFTNMTPQLSGLNSASWADLENRVRVWCESFDTLYVVTGCTVKGSTEVAYDNDGKAVTVPTGYYKALLGYKKDGSIGNSSQSGGYIGCAFWFDHVAFSGDFMTKAMTISELEEKTGVNFFVNLPEATGADKAKTIEGTKDSWWK